MKPTDRHRRYEVFNIVWNCIELQIRHTPDWTKGFDHIEVFSAGRVPLPITETGYRSIFLTAAQLRQYESITAFVLAWLEHDSQSPDWKNSEAQRAQLSLF